MLTVGRERVSRKRACGQKIRSLVPDGTPRNFLKLGLTTPKTFSLGLRGVLGILCVLVPLLQNPRSCCALTGASWGRFSRSPGGNARAPTWCRNTKLQSEASLDGGVKATTVYPWGETSRVKSPYGNDHGKLGVTVNEGKRGNHLPTSGKRQKETSWGKES